MTFLRRCHGFLSIRGDDRKSDKTIAENLKIRKMHYGGGLQREHFQAVESERQRPLRFWPKRTCPATKGSDSSERGPADLPATPVQSCSSSWVPQAKHLSTTERSLCSLADRFACCLRRDSDCPGWGGKQKQKQMQRAASSNQMALPSNPHRRCENSSPYKPAGRYISKEAPTV